MKFVRDLKPLSSTHRHDIDFIKENVFSVIMVKIRFDYFYRINEPWFDANAIKS